MDMGKSHKEHANRGPGFPDPPGQHQHGFEAALDNVRETLNKASLYLARLDKLVGNLVEEHDVEVSRARASPTRVLEREDKEKTLEKEIAEAEGQRASWASSDYGGVLPKEMSDNLKEPGSNPNTSGEVPRDAMSAVTPVASSITLAVAVSATKPNRNLAPLAQAAEPSEPEEPDESSSNVVAELPRCVSGDTVQMDSLVEEEMLRRRSGSSTQSHLVVELCKVWEGIDRRPSRKLAAREQNSRRETQEGQVKRASMRQQVGRGFSRSKSNLFAEGEKKADLTTKLSSAMKHRDPRQCGKYLSEHLVASPTSTRRLVWDIAGMALIAYDLVMFPLMFFHPPRYIVFDIMALLTTIFWTCDIPMSFLVGYHDGGIIKLNLADIARKYARSWLIFDVCIVCVDWVATMIDIANSQEDESAGKHGNVGAVRIVKSARFLRMLRLLRLLKVHGKFEHILEHIQSEFARIVLGICQLIAFIICANHVIACLFYAISAVDDEGTRWVNAFGVRNRSLAYRYFTSLHWSLTQFTPASMEITPKNAIERLFNVVTLLFAMITFSSFVSSLTNAMTQLRNLNSDRLQQQTVLRKYLRDHGVNVSLTTRIWHWLNKDTKGHRRRIHEKEVVILSTLPSTLQAELRNQVVGPFIVPHPFFFQFGGSNPMLMRRVYKSLTEHSAMTGKEIFTVGDVGDSMYFVVSGICKYYVSTSGLNIDGSVSVAGANGYVQRASGGELKQGDALLTTGNWMCEPVLWVKWRHLGQLVSKEHTELFSLVASRFHHIIEHNVADAWSVVRYAKLFAQRLRDQPGINDIWADFDNLQEMAQNAFQDDDQDHTDVSISLSRTLPTLSTAAMNPPRVDAQ